MTKYLTEHEGAWIAFSALAAVVGLFGLHAAAQGAVLVSMALMLASITALVYTVGITPTAARERWER